MFCDEAIFPHVNAFEGVVEMNFFWKLKGIDTFSGDTYSLGNEYPDKESALTRADEIFKNLEESQPAESSGGQEEGGIQDQIYLVAPDGSSERILPR